MKRKLGVFATASRDKLPSLLRLLRDVGFETVASDLYTREEVLFLKSECDRIGLELTFLHAPYYVDKPFYIHTNEFWKADLTCLPLLNATLETIDAASESGVGMIVMHVSGGWNPPPVSDVGFSRFDRLVEYAVKRDVRIAFENIRNVGNLSAIMERYERIPNVVFCYDCGHEHCYTPGVRFLDFFGNRAACTHIHDNPGRDPADWNRDNDLHILPFDGTVDYRQMIGELDRYGYAGPLTLEIEYGGEYAEKMTLEEFYRTAFERMKRIADLSPN